MTPVEERPRLAAERKLSGKYNCAQAVACTYAAAAGIDEDVMMRAAAAFGVGMGNMEGTCGALVGAGLVLGMTGRDRPACMKAMRQMMTEFNEMNGATQCRLLKGLDTGRVLRECHDCVADAARLLERHLDAPMASAQ